MSYVACEEVCMRKSLYRVMALVSVNAAVMILAAGCATRDEQSFNDNYNQDSPAAPKYTIDDIAPDRFKVRMHQGAPMMGSSDMNPARITYMKQAMNTVVTDEARRRGWGNWDLRYIQERDSGWMHILVADVRERPAVEMANPPPDAVTPPPPPTVVVPSSPPPP